MNPICHLQAGSILAHVREYNFRERRLIMLAALFPDLDGLLMPLDYVHKVIPAARNIYVFSGEFGFSMHHTISHNIFTCMIFALGAALYNRARRAEMFLVCTVSALLQILLDMLTNDPSWPQKFLRPLTDYDFLLVNFIPMEDPFFTQVIAIQYTLIAVLCAGTVWIYLKHGRTFLELISPRLDLLLTNFIRLPFSEKCAVCGGRAFYREEGTDNALCPEHAHVHRDLTATRETDGGGQADDGDDTEDGGGAGPAEGAAVPREKRDGEERPDDV